MQRNNHKIKVNKFDFRSSKVKSHPERSRRVTVVNPINYWAQLCSSVNPQGLLHYYRSTEKGWYILYIYILLIVKKSGAYTNKKILKKICF